MNWKDKFEKDYKKMLAVVTKSTKNRNVSEDIVHNAYIMCCETPPGSEKELYTLLFRAKNIYNESLTKKNVREVNFDIDIPEDVSEKIETNLDRVNDKRMSLTGNMEKVTDLLSENEDITDTEIAEIVGISKNQVWVIKTRLREKFINYRENIK